MKKKHGLNPDGETSEPSDKCPICLCPITSQPVGSLDNCPHVFCLQCVLQWSQTASTCPVDRISFGFIHQRRSPAGVVQKLIRARPQTKDEEDGSSPVICEECGRSDRRLLLCSLCDSGFHLDCLTPSLNCVPEGDWICPECGICPQNTESFRSEEEISDGELTDLLAEVDQTPCSSRLRASTLNCPSSFNKRRQSSRIQSSRIQSSRIQSSRMQNSGGSGPRPQTCWHVPKHLLRMSTPTRTLQVPEAPADLQSAFK